MIRAVDQEVAPTMHREVARAMDSSESAWAEALVWAVCLALAVA